MHTHACLKLSSSLHFTHLETVGTSVDRVLSIGPETSLSPPKLIFFLIFNKAQPATSFLLVI